MQNLEAKQKEAASRLMKYQNEMWYSWLANKPGLEGWDPREKRIIWKWVDISPHFPHQGICWFLSHEGKILKAQPERGRPEGEKWDSLIVLRSLKLEVRAQQGVKALKNISRLLVKTPDRLQIGVKDKVEIS